MTIGENTAERIAAITAERAAELTLKKLQEYMESGKPFMVRREPGIGRIWAWFKAALKHAAETADKIRIE